MPTLNLRKTGIALLVGLGAAGVALGLGQTGLVQTLELKLYDQRLRSTADGTTARRDLVLVAIDEYSIRQMEPFVGRWPWPRFVHGQVVDLLKAAGARVIVYDVLFTERDRRTGFLVGDETWTGAESDQAFADAARAAGNVVFAAEATSDVIDAAPPLPDAPWARVTPDDSFEPRPSLTLPYPELAAAARALGHNLLVVDADGPVRRSIPFVRVGAAAVPSLPVAAVMVGEGIDPTRVRFAEPTLHIGPYDLPTLREQVPVFAGSGDARQWSQRALIPYRGPAVAPDGTTTLYDEFSFVKLLAARQQQLDGADPGIDLSRFDGATVVVGLTAAGLHDVYQSPFGATGKMSGPMVQASVIDQVVSRRALRPWPRWAGAVAVALAGLVAAGLVMAAPLRASLPALGGLALLATWANIRAFAAGQWVPLAEPWLSMVFAAFAGVAWQFFVEGREKRAVKRLFSRYLSRDVYEQVLANPALAELGGNRREMSVLFSDIRGFTAMTEKGQPEAIVAMLNQYFSRMVDIVFAHRGTLDKFVGDMVMALYGAPLDDADHADHAVQTALAMVAELERLNEEWARSGRPPMDIGIGINSGEMIAGNIGAEAIRSYTVIGDNVNLGSRLESLNKDYGTRIIVSQFTVERLKQRYDLQPLGAVRVKGKTTSVDIYEVRGLAAPPEAR